MGVSPILSGCIYLDRFGGIHLDKSGGMHLDMSGIPPKKILEIQLFFSVAPLFTPTQ